jgi:Mrp family chromosome partitioning ATPase/uncharacterized protein involved in exopolysaccharide biosynthesis
MNDAFALPRDHVDLALRFARRMLRHAWRGAIVLLVGLLATGATVSLRPKRWMSQTVLYYQEGISWELHGESPRTVSQRLREMLLARSRLEQVVEGERLFPELVARGRLDVAVDDFRKRIVLRMSEGGAFAIAYTGDSPEEAQRVTARLAQLVIEDNARYRAGRVEGAKGFFDAQTKRNEDELRRREAELALFLANHPEFVPQGGTVGAAVRSAAAQGIQPELDGAAVRSAAPPPQADPLAPLVAARAQAEAALAAARRDHAEASRTLTEKHPSMMAATERLKGAEEAFRRASDALAAESPRAAPVAGARPARAAPARPPPRVPAAATPGVVALETEYARLSRAVADERARLQSLDARHFAATMAATSVASGQAGQITVIDPAYVPTRATGFRVRLLWLAGGALSLLLALGACAAFAFFDDRIYDRHDVERLRVAPLLAEIPRPPGARRGAEGAEDAPDERPDPAAGSRTLPAAPGRELRLLTTGEEHRNGDGSLRNTALAVAARAPWEAPGEAAPEPPADAPAEPVDPEKLDPRLLLLRAPDSPAAASFRVLRHRVVERGGDDAQVLLVTSCGPDEGKTTCALNLALALSEGGRAKVLLLDAQFRRPAIARILGLLQFRTPEPWIAIEQITPFLHVALDSQPRFVDAGAIAARLERLRADGYDFIVIDGPPILGSADVNALQEGASGVVVTMWSQRSSATSLRAGIEQIGGDKVLGIVLMGT